MITKLSNLHVRMFAYFVLTDERAEQSQGDLLWAMRREEPGSVIGKVLTRIWMRGRGSQERSTMNRLIPEAPRLVLVIDPNGVMTEEQIARWRIDGATSFAEEAHTPVRAIPLSR